jgi:hypothetical protein
MSNDAYLSGASLLKTGTLVSFRILEEEVLPAHDEAEFRMRVSLQFVPEGCEDDQDEDDVAEDTAEWGAFGFIFTLGVLSFGEAKPRSQSTADYNEKDEFNVADFIRGLRFVRGNYTSTQITFAAVVSRPVEPCAPTVRCDWRPSVAARQCCAGSSGCKEKSFFKWSANDGSQCWVSHC